MALNDLQYNPFTRKLDIAGTSDASMTEAEINALCPLESDDAVLPDGVVITSMKHTPLTADEIEQLTPFDEPDAEPTDTAVKTENVGLSYGTYFAETKEIKWYAGNGVVRLTQSKGYGTTAVNDSYIAAPRFYKGHILYLETLVVGAYIQSIRIKYSGQYKGNNMVAGVETDTSNNVLQNTDLIQTNWSTENDGEHVVETINGQGLTQIYIQNSSTETTVQLRVVNIEITYRTTT
jgi:hypothetical protein